MNPTFKLEPQQWALLRALLDEALALPAAERPAWFAGLDDERLAGLGPRLQALLAHAGDETATADRLFGTLPKIETGAFAAPPGATGEQPGASVGPYRLIRELGSGGMGSVWLAERTDMLQRRQVALKLPHGAWKRAGLAERLAREREILAMLEHPNIARLYDAGVADGGRPWLALEYVAGERIDAWCDRRMLDVPARLRLFLQVARAVAHAHAQLVVHRDLKPSNILVTGEGAVKLLDFGIAKLLDGDVAQETELTRAAGRALTPEYAAPEQILGQPIGTAADVYALGVLLYELLTGRRPYTPGRDSRAALEEAIVEGEVPTPSARAPEARRRVLRGDLDAIVLEALRREPALRYATVAAMAEDIERFLRDEPVRARPHGRVHRLRKFVRRHGLAVGAATAVVLALVAGALVAAWQAAQARADAQAARRALRIANANVTLTEFFASDIAAQRSNSELVQQVERAVGMVRGQYGDDALVRGRLLGDLGAHFRRLGEWERYRAISAEAEVAARQAGDAELAAQLACRRARDVAQGGNLAEAGRVIDEAMKSLDRLDPPPDSVRVGCLADASAVARAGGDALGALRTAQRIIDIEVAAGSTQSATHADSLLILARAQALAARHADAAGSLRAGLAIQEQLGTARTPGANNLRVLLAGVLTEGGQAQPALEILQRVLDEHARGGGAPRAVASVLWHRGLAHLALGRHGDAEADFGAALADARASGDRSLVRASIVGLVTAQARAGRVAAAETQLAEALALYREPLAQRSYNARLAHFAHAEVALAAEDGPRAAAAIDAAAEIVRLRATVPGDAAARTIEVLRARLALAGQRGAEAVRHAAAALALARAQAIDVENSVHVRDDEALLAAARRLLPQQP